MADFDDLLDGLEGDAREARRRLLERLHGDGVPLDELRRAVDEERLVLVPVERELHGDAQLTALEVAERAGLDPDQLRAMMRASGLPTAADDEAMYGESDVEAARRLKAVLDAGLPLDGLLDATRVMGRGLSQTAAAFRQLVGSAMIRPGDREDEAAERLVDATRGLMPTMGPTLEYFFARHVLELIRSDVLGVDVLETGRIGAERQSAVAFADLVGFTRLGSDVASEDLGGIARRLEAMASEVTEPPVRIVKTIGDAVMLAAPEARAAIDASLSLVEAVDDAGEDFPQVKCGVACGPVVERDGDLYGHAVNVASRITDIARPGSVLVAEAAREEGGDGFAWSFAHARELKGVSGRVKLFRARRAGDGDDAG